ncbi:MAG: glycosyltransferase family 2 protein [Gemmatimonadota bacterium]|nr:glycosyltransferase family 2 protein [Gemmatimonadota bacterium]
MEDIAHPLVSIGVPVFNGEKGLARALDSLIGQDYSNLEIIISDNASTDTTPAICERYVCKDSRIKYYRSEKNFGAIWNFNRVFGLSCGKYFMWAAHDDQRHASFVNACVEKMEEWPNAVLCQVHTAIFIEAREEMLCLVHLDSFEGVTGLVERYRETLSHLPATAIYGLYRSSAMRKTQMLRRSLATDIAFNQELSIHGDFVQVPRILFHYFGREKWNTIDQDFRVYFGKAKPWWYSPFVMLFLDHWRRVWAAPIPLSTKLRLWSVLLEHEVGQVALKILIKITGRVSPLRWKEKVGGAIYRRWMLSPNVTVCCEPLFLERAIKPTIGWWR